MEIEEHVGRCGEDLGTSVWEDPHSRDGGRISPKTIEQDWVKSCFHASRELGGTGDIQNKVSLLGVMVPERQVGTKERQVGTKLRKSFWVILRAKKNV